MSSTVRCVFNSKLVFAIHIVHFRSIETCMYALNLGLSASIIKFAHPNVMYSTCLVPGSDVTRKLALIVSYSVSLQNAYLRWV